MNAPGTARKAPTPNGPSARYGSRKNGTFTGKVLAVVFAVILIAVVVYIVSMFRNQTSVDVQAVETGGKVLSDEAIQTNIDITRDDPNKSAFCIVYALDYDKNEVGRREVFVPAGGDATERYSLTMPTRERAHAAQVYGCSSVTPPHLDQPN